MASISSELLSGLVNSIQVVSDINMQFMASMQQKGLYLEPSFGGSEPYSSNNQIKLLVEQNFTSEIGLVTTDFYITYESTSSSVLSLSLTIKICDCTYKHNLLIVYGIDSIRRTLYELNCQRTGILNRTGLLKFFDEVYEKIMKKAGVRK